MPKSICLEGDEMEKVCNQPLIDLNIGVVMVACMCQLEWIMEPKYLVKCYSGGDYGAVPR